VGPLDRHSAAAFGLAPWRQVTLVVRPREIIMISINEFRKGYQEFQKRERRDAMYKTATFIVNHFWGNPSDMVDGMGVLLLTWNQAFYRYGSFDFDKLEQVLTKHFNTIASYRVKDITTLQKADEQTIITLFNEFLDALQIADGKKKGTKSPVAVAKALHLLGPSFFPLWDEKIARAYDCYYNSNPAHSYIAFSYKMKNIASSLANQVSTSNKTLLKLIDEYNYAKYTKEWI